MTATAPPLVGSWGRADSFVGVVAAIDEEAATVTLFDPGQRQQHTAALDAFEPVPAAAVRVTLRVGLPVAHGLDEQALRRWVAMLTDPVLRERASQAMTDAGLDDGVALPSVAIDVGRFDDATSVCLCGATAPAGSTASGAATAPGDTADAMQATPTTAASPAPTNNGAAACARCGRQLAPPVPSTDI